MSSALVIHGGYAAVRVERVCERAEESKASEGKGEGESAHDKMEWTRPRVHPRKGTRRDACQSSVATRPSACHLANVIYCISNAKKTRKTGTPCIGHYSKDKQLSTTFIFRVNQLDSYFLLNMMKFRIRCRIDLGKFHIFFISLNQLLKFFPNTWPYLLSLGPQHSGRLKC